MILKPTRPIREWKYLLTYKLHGGEVMQHELTPEQDVKMTKLLTQFEKFLDTDQPVEGISVDVGDRQEVYIPEGEEPLPGIQTAQDIK